MKPDASKATARPWEVLQQIAEREVGRCLVTACDAMCADGRPCVESATVVTNDGRRYCWDHAPDYATPDECTIIRTGERLESEGCAP